jgi:hypothetical protein
MGAVVALDTAREPFAVPQISRSQKSSRSFPLSTCSNWPSASTAIRSCCHPFQVGGEERRREKRSGWEGREKRSRILLCFIPQRDLNPDLG